MSEVQVSEAEIAVHWREEELFHPPPKFIGQANANDPAIFDRFTEKNFPECFKEYADLLTWDKYWHTTLDTSNAPFWKWFVGGKLNASYNCVDRHLAKYRNKAALIWVAEPEAEATQVITYQELYKRVNEFAALLADYCGLKAGDRVTFHLPMVPELPVSMLACARIGVIHSEVFGGFSGAACGGRIADSGSEILITMDGYYRNGELLDHKIKADEAVEEAKKQGQKVDKVLIWRRHPGKYSSKTEIVKGRDFFIDELLADYKGKIVEPVSMPAEAPLFLMYTSGTTAKPKGCQHSTGGYLAYVAGTSKYYQDIHPEDTYWCFADIGWITGHSYIVYGPLALAATSVMYEGVPTYPDPGRPWRIAERLNVNHRRHLVADGERWLPVQHAARPAADEARKLRPGCPGHLPGNPRRARQADSEGKQQGRQHHHPQSVARNLPDHLRRPGQIRVDLLRQVQQEEAQQGLARLAVLRRRRGSAG